MEYDLPKIEGVDWEKAYHYMPDKPTLIDTLQEFVSSADRETERLSDFKETLLQNGSEENYAAFRIQAHALKSNLRSIGADLFDNALSLENAGKSMDRETIMQKTDAFIADYRELIQKLTVITGGKKAAAAFDRTLYLEKISAIKEAMEAFDVSTLQDNMEAVENMDIPDKYKADTKELANTVRDLMSDNVIEICEKIKAEVDR